MEQKKKNTGLKILAVMLTIAAAIIYFVNDTGVKQKILHTIHDQKLDDEIIFSTGPTTGGQMHHLISFESVNKDTLPVEGGKIYLIEPVQALTNDSDSVIIFVTTRITGIRNNVGKYRNVDRFDDKTIADSIAKKHRRDLRIAVSNMNIDELLFDLHSKNGEKFAKILKNVSTRNNRNIKSMRVSAIRIPYNNKTDSLTRTIYGIKFDKTRDTSKEVALYFNNFYPVGQSDNEFNISINDMNDPNGKISNLHKKDYSNLLSLLDKNDSLNSKINQKNWNQFKEDSVQRASTLKGGMDTLLSIIFENNTKLSGAKLRLDNAEKRLKKVENKIK